MPDPERDDAGAGALDAARPLDADVVDAARPFDAEVADAGLDAPLDAATGDAMAPLDASADAGDDPCHSPMGWARLFRHLAVPGASNSLTSSEDSYHGVVAAQAMVRFGECLGTPERTVFRTEDRHLIPADATLLLSLDVFWADHEPASIRDDLAALAAALPGVPFLASNLPEADPFDTPPYVNEAIADGLDAHEGYFLFDADDVYDKLLAGRIRYDGAVLTRDDVFSDAVHLSDLGQLVVGDLYIARLNALFPGLELPPRGELEILP